MPSVVTSQTDFSAGEIDSSVKRADQSESIRALLKSGARQAANGRILNSKAWQNRPGRRALFKETGRVEEIQLGPTSKFFLCFGAGTLRVYDSTGATQLFTESGRPWTNATAKSVVYAIFDKAIFICFTSGVPRVLTWDGITTFTAADYAETVRTGNQKRTFFYRISPKNITMQPSGTTGSVTLTFSAGMNLVAGHIGTRMRFVGRQLLITAVASAISATATVQETLAPAETVTFASDPRPFFAVGDVVVGSVSGAAGVVTAVGNGPMDVQLRSQLGFLSTESVIGPNGTLGGITGIVTIAPQPVSVWDDEVMNAFRGWPNSVTVDQGRLIFCNFPAVPRGIGWSAFGLPNDLYIEATGIATSAIFELAPENAQVYFVQPGPDGSEFAMCSNAIWRIPISATNPLKPGSVGFEVMTSEGCANVQPRKAFEHVFYLSVGLTRVMVLIPSGNYTHPHTSRDISELSTHLFTSPIAIAIPTADGTFPERYLYVLNSNGSIAQGKLTTVDGQLNVTAVVGWVPWPVNGNVKWVAALNSDVIFTTSYAPNAIAAVMVVEILDDTYYLDAAQLYNVQPVGLPIPGGKGPLWWLAGGTVDLMDVGARPIGLSTVNTVGNMTANGGLAAAFNGAYVQTQAVSADRAAADGFVGLNYTSRQIIGQVLVWPSSDAGFAVGGSGNVTIELRASATAPALSSDGTLLATLTLANQAVGPVVVSPPYNVTSYQYAWVRIFKTGATAVVCAQAFFAVGPTWWLNGGSIQVGARMMGTYTVDANGFIVPQGNAGEDLASLTLVAGQAWVATLEPFIPMVQAGQDVQQRMWPRRLQRVQTYVRNSTGFVMERLYSDESGANLPAAGTVMKQRRIATWNVGEDPTLPPPLREQSYLDRPLGRSHDPRWSIVKDTPGPLTVLEIATEVTA